MTELSPETRFACAPEVVGKVIDGEAIIINLASGMYYSADEVGGFIWALIESGYSIDEVAARVGSHYEIDTARARTDTNAIAVRLIDEGLIMPADRRPEDSAAVESPLERRAYVAPSIEVYRDMKDLLALDPPMQALKTDPWERS